MNEVNEGNCTGLHPYGPCAPSEGCNRRPVTRPVPPPEAVEIALGVVRDRDCECETATALAAPAALAERYAFVDHERLAVLEAVADLARSYFRVRPGRIAVEIRSALAALDAAPAETGEQLATRLTDRMRARDATEPSADTATPPLADNGPYDRLKVQVGELFDIDTDQWRRRSAAAALAPEVGMGFHEMYSHWVFVVAVTEHVVQVVRGGGHPSHFPECGELRNIPRAEFPELVRYEYLADRGYDVDGWAARAENIKVEQLEERIRTTGRR